MQEDVFPLEVHAASIGSFMQALQAPLQVSIQTHSPPTGVLNKVRKGLATGRLKQCRWEACKDLPGDK